jgi:[acyl-carrier-protein] S-malonyltransferase
MLKSVFRTKKTPLDEQENRFNNIFNKTDLRKIFPEYKMHA